MVRFPWQMGVRVNICDSNPVKLRCEMADFGQVNDNDDIVAGWSNRCMPDLHG